MIKELNLSQKTQMEQHSENQNKFKKIMHILRHLEDDEKKDFVHMI